MRKLRVAEPEKCIGCQICMFACSRRYGEAGLGKPRLLVKSVGGMERGFIIINCRACIEPPCAKVCPAKALSVKEGGGVICDVKKCIGCKKCQSACLIGAIFWDDDNNKPLICLHCGYCSEYCEHGVFEISAGEEEKDDDQ